jgi:hypothetical protein
MYLLIGGYAVGYHGYPHATNDMDVWTAIQPDNAQRIVDALKDFGFDHPDLTPELFLQKNKIIRMGIHRCALRFQQAFQAWNLKSVTPAEL